MSAAGVGGRIELARGDITALEVDAIVNAANPRLAPGGGVCGAIHQAAGPELAEACARVAEVRPGVRCPVGEARITPGFGLRASHVIHAVGPTWVGGGAGEPEALAACYRACLGLAREHGCASVAFCAISCGIYGYPVGPACVVALGAIGEALRAHAEPGRVVLCCFDGEVYSAYARLLGRG